MNDTEIAFFGLAILLPLVGEAERFSTLLSRDAKKNCRGRA